MRTTRRELTKAFEIAASLMGWDTDPAYVGGNPRIGATFLEHNRISGWSVGQIVNHAGGEQTIKQSCTAAEMYGWLCGVSFAKRSWALALRVQS